MPTPPTPPRPPQPTGAPTPPHIAPGAGASPTGRSTTAPAEPSSATSTSQTSAVQPSAPAKPHGELDRRTLQAMRTFDVLLRNGQTWHGVRLLEMDSWSLLLEVPEQGRVLLPKHAVDAYLLGQSR
jgi:hypothetical protein